MLAITDVSNCQQKFCFLYYLFASSKGVKVSPILCYNTSVFRPKRFIDFADWEIETRIRFDTSVKRLLVRVLGGRRIASVKFSTRKREFAIRKEKRDGKRRRQATQTWSVSVFENNKQRLKITWLSLQTKFVFTSCYLSFFTLIEIDATLNRTLLTI